MEINICIFSGLIDNEPLNTFCSSGKSLMNEQSPNLNSNKTIIDFLVQQFPNCFDVTNAPKPLKIGIFQELAERLNSEDDENSSLSKTKLRQALRTYTSNWRYLHCIKIGSHRVDLDGNIVSEITEEEQQFAQEKLAESRKQFNERKKQQQAKSNEKPKFEKKPIKKIKQPTVQKKTEQKKITVKPASHFSQVLNQALVQSNNNASVKHENEPNAKPKQTAAKQIECSEQKTTFNIGDNVLINMDKEPTKATILTIERNIIRVKVESGMELAVSAQHIVSE